MSAMTSEAALFASGHKCLCDTCMTWSFFYFPIWGPSKIWWLLCSQCQFLVPSCYTEVNICMRDTGKDFWSSSKLTSKLAQQTCLQKTKVLTIRYLFSLQNFLTKKLATAVLLILHSLLLRLKWPREMTSSMLLVGKDYSCSDDACNNHRPNVPVIKESIFSCNNLNCEI